MLCTDENTLLPWKKWTEHLSTMLNCPSTVSDSAINILPEKECNLLQDEFSTIMKTRKEIQYLSSIKAPGAGAIPAKIYKADGQAVL